MQGDGTLVLGVVHHQFWRRVVVVLVQQEVHLAGDSLCSGSVALKPPTSSLKEEEEESTVGHLFVCLFVVSLLKAKWSHTTMTSILPNTLGFSHHHHQYPVRFELHSTLNLNSNLLIQLSFLFKIKRPRLLYRWCSILAIDSDSDSMRQPTIIKSTIRRCTTRRITHHRTIHRWSITTTNSIIIKWTIIPQPLPSEPTECWWMQQQQQLDQFIIITSRQIHGQLCPSLCQLMSRCRSSLIIWCTVTHRPVICHLLRLLIAKPQPLQQLLHRQSSHQPQPRLLPTIRCFTFRRRVTLNRLSLTNRWHRRKRWSVITNTTTTINTFSIINIRSRLVGRGLQLHRLLHPHRRPLLHQRQPLRR